jgi:hypothetical protein
MRVDVRCLREQAWRAEKLYREMKAYAKSIGCTVVQDEITCNDDIQANALAMWWMERANI